MAVNSYQLIVDYDRSVEDGTIAGYYDWSNPDINSHNFPIGRWGKFKIVVRLIFFRRNISNAEALSELDKMGYRPANIAELLAFGEKFPDVQREFSVIAIGSVYGGSVACLTGRVSRRDLLLSPIGAVWNTNFRFAAVHKSTLVQKKPSIAKCERGF